MSTTIKNPILPGFHPDPCMICVDGTFYLANSTFEWFPGVEISVSTDLVHWKTAARPLATSAMLDMRGEMFSDGVWAPCLTFNKEEKLFYLIFTDVKSSQNVPFKDTHNYLTTAPAIEGPWSAPVYLNSAGFDPSLFHDDDGRKYLVNMEWDFRRQGKDCFAGIKLQEYDAAAQKLTGPVHHIFTRTAAGVTEGPHLYKRNGWYYLMTAEGGTGYEHQVSIARSASLTGPYTEHPANPLLSAWEPEALPETSHVSPQERYRLMTGSSRLKKAGHGSWCEAPDGSWYLVHLCGRPLDNRGRCVLGRETGLQRLVWKEDGWPYLAQGGCRPADTVTVPYDAGYTPKEKQVYDLWKHDFLTDFQSLRIPFGSDWGVIDTEKQCLRLRGRESIVSRFSQSLLARRQTDVNFAASVSFHFEPLQYRHMAGFTYRYCETNLFYAYLTFNEEIGQNVMTLARIDGGNYACCAEVPVTGSDFTVGVTVNGTNGQFFFAAPGKPEVPLGSVQDTGILSDECVRPFGFTGAFVGFCVQDMQSQERTAEFTRFVYEPLTEADTAARF